jgi:hypothetical protein
LLDDVLDHIVAKNSGALGGNHLTLWVFIEFHANENSAFGAALAPAVLNVVKAEKLTIFER